MPVELYRKSCMPCRGGVARLTAAEAAGLSPAVPDWRLEDESTKLVRDFRFADFARALAFVDAVGAVAEREGHHPDICFGWGRASVTLFTHKIGGLHDNDFIMAAKIDRILAGPAPG